MKIFFTNILLSFSRLIMKGITIVAFSNADKRAITVCFTLKENGNVVLDYFDSGEWIEKDKNGFGIELLELLTDQLEGTLKRNGSVYKIEFPIS